MEDHKLKNGSHHEVPNTKDATTIEDLCKNLAFYVRYELENSALPEDKSGDEDTAAIIVTLSNSIMGALDTDSASNLSPKEFDYILQKCLLDAYRIPSVVHRFHTETVAFYDWWRGRIQGWIRGPTTSIAVIEASTQHRSAFRRLGWHHLTAMIRETRDHLRPPPRSVSVRGAGSRIVNGDYKLARRCLSRGDDGKQNEYRYYGKDRLTYEKTTTDGRTLSLCLCGVDASPTSTTQHLGHGLWFLTELDEEQPFTDCDIDYYCALPRSGKRERERTNPIPPLEGWKRCSRGGGLFPPPTLVQGRGVVRSGSGSETYGHALARWILEEDVLAMGRSKPTPLDEAACVGIASVLEFLLDLYEETGDSLEQASHSLGTELLVKFAAVCLEGHSNAI